MNHLILRVYTLQVLGPTKKKLRTFGIAVIPSRFTMQYQYGSSSTNEEA